MKRHPFALLTLLIVASLSLAACSPPPPLVSSKYLNDNSLITGKSASGADCVAPCFQDVTVGQTTFSDAVAKIKANKLFSSVQTQDSSSSNPATATWNTAAGEACCQMSANDKGLVDVILIKYAPDAQVTADALIKKFGDPKYVSGTDYSSTEVAVALIFPTQGLISWVSPGDATSTLQPTNPMVVATYLNPARFSDLLKTATLQGWNGYLSYQVYRTATPIITPQVTPTKAS